MQLNNCVVFITGSADRVGKAIALALARKGAQLAIHYYSSAQKARQTAKEIGQLGRVPLVLQGDISQKNTWLTLKNEILQAFGRIDVLVNNAAIFYRTPFMEVTGAQWDQFMNVNLKSAFWGCQVMGEVMVSQQRGKIINLADISAQRVWGGYIPYCVSKAGVVALTRGLARALAPHVTVNAVAPGAVLLPDDFDAAQRQHLVQKIPLKRIGSAEDVAQTVAFLIEGGDFITGAVIPVDGGQAL